MGGIHRHTVPPTQPKEGQPQFKNKKQPELTENQTVWKSNNQGVKEDTFIQTSGRGGEEQSGREDSQQGSGWRTGVGKAAAGGHSNRLCNPGLQHGEIKPQISD